MIELKGLEEVKARLLDMPKKAGKSIVRKALREGAKPILETARANAPVQSGALKRSIKIRSMRTRKDFVRIIVGVGKKWFAGPTFYAAFLEWGFKHGNRTQGTARKEIPGKHFIQQAYEQRKRDAVAQIERSLLDGMLRAAEGGE